MIDATTLAEWIDEWDDDAMFLDSGADPIGIRVQDEPLEVGPFDHTSNRWDDGVDTGEPVLNADGEEVDGVSVVAIPSTDPDDVARSLAIASRYAGRHMGVLIGEDMEYGEDEGEIILTGDVECILVIG